MRLTAQEIRSMLPAGRVREWLRSSDLRESWENRPKWLRAERAPSGRRSRSSWFRRRRRWYEEIEAEDVLKGALAGAIGGMVGSLTMVLAKNLIQKLGQGRRAKQTEKAARPAREYAQVRAGELESERFGYGEPAERGEWRPRHEAQEEASTEKVADIVSRRVLRRDLGERGRQIGGQVVHYGYGAAMGAVYGGVAEAAPAVTAGFGMPAATVLWAVGDEIAVPALKLSKHPREYPLSQHATYLAMHLVYGVTTEFIRRTLRRMMS